MMNLVAMAVAALAIAALAISFVLFVGYLTRPQSVSSRHIQPPQAIHLLIVLGSGGHTEEMLSMIKHARLDPRIYSKRTYLVSSGDSFSTRKAVDFERKLLQSNNPNNGIHTLDGENPTSSRNQEIPAYARLPAEDLGLQAEYTIVTIPRARKVHQSFLTAPFSTLQCFWACLLVLSGKHPDQTRSGPEKIHFTAYPNLILTNGPGISVCVVIAARLLRCFDHLFRWSLQSSRRSGESRSHNQKRCLRTIFIESWARVTTLSLSGKLVLPIVDRFLVQWEPLEGHSSWNGKKTEYVGPLLS